MPQLLPRTPFLPTTGSGESNYDIVLRRALFTALFEILGTINALIVPVDPSRLAIFTVATVPAAADWLGALIHVSNEAGGAVPAFSDGTNWRRVTDRAVIS